MTVNNNVCMYGRYVCMCISVLKQNFCKVEFGFLVLITSNQNFLNCEIPFHFKNIYFANNSHFLLILYLRVISPVISTAIHPKAISL